MNKALEYEGLEAFQELVKGIKPLTQDKQHFGTPLPAKVARQELAPKLAVQHYFSDTFQPLLPSDGPMRWRAEHADKQELKRLRRGDYPPDLILDLHGMRQTEAKLELAALLEACIREQCQCCCVMHGYGTGILKQQLPLWLAQHPKVKAFHQAPKEWGGDAALLVLVDIGDQPFRR
ncbi:endonuclease SmrB [Shewanella sedimentimangrovi]|uniref:Ribosome rescue factor SmrB n=1 Tax=Shewanella sedimentimangrovi TaxID=2814293 RepID=A0ABX7QZB6_9GAMM|nr:endonuclease SmrB [Shewanella sedimentimangrovi]QSX35948.1 endonuclease SmrB [Shewanella sedimentimangrovi]